MTSWESHGFTKPVLALSIARMGDAIGNSILFLVIPLYVAQLPSVALHLPEEVLVGILISLFGVISSVLQPVAGALSDRFGRRKPLIQVGLVLMGLSTLTFSAAHRYLDLVLLRTLQGVGVSLTIPASMSLMAAITERKNRGGSMGVYSTLRMVGFAIGPLIGGFLQVHYGFDAAFVAGASFIAVGIVVVQIWVREAPVRERGAGDPPRVFRLFDLSLLHPGILAAAGSTFLMASSFSMVTTLENEFNARLRMTAFDFSIVFSSMILGRLVLQVPLGRLSDRLGRRPFILTGLLGIAAATALLGVAGSMSQLVILRLLQGVASAGIAAPAFAVAADLARIGGEGRQMSVITTGFGVGIALGPLIAGLLAVVFFELPFLASGVMSLVGAWAVWRWMPETAGRGRHAPVPPEGADAL